MDLFNKAMYNSHSGGFRGTSRRPATHEVGGSGRFMRAKRPSRGENIHVSKFINKAVITEEIENFKPEHAFKDFKIENTLKHKIVQKGYVSPTPIQDRAIP